MTYTPEGDWQDIGAAELRYLRGASEGAFELRLKGMRPGTSLFLYPDGVTSARHKRLTLEAGLGHILNTPRLKRLNSDDRAMWLIGYLWAKGIREVELQHNPASRV